MLATDKALPRFLIGWGCFFCPQWTHRGAGDAFGVSAQTFFFLTCIVSEGRKWKWVFPPHKAGWEEYLRSANTHQSIIRITAAERKWHYCPGGALLWQLSWNVYSSVNGCLWSTWSQNGTAAKGWVFTVTSWQSRELSDIDCCLEFRNSWLVGNVKKWWLIRLTTNLP